MCDGEASIEYKSICSGTQYMCLMEQLLLSTLNIYFYGEIRKICCFFVCVAKTHLIWSYGEGTDH